MIQGRHKIKDPLTCISIHLTLGCFFSSLCVCVFWREEFSPFFFPPLDNIEKKASSSSSYVVHLPCRILSCGDAGVSFFFFFFCLCPFYFLKKKNVVNNNTTMCTLGLNWLSPSLYIPPLKKRKCVPPSAISALTSTGNKFMTWLALSLLLYLFFLIIHSKSLSVE